MTTVTQLYDREVQLHPIIEGQIHYISPHKEGKNHIPGMCYDCNCSPEYVVEERNGDKWLWCGFECGGGG